MSALAARRAAQAKLKAAAPAAVNEASPPREPTPPPSPAPSITTVSESEIEVEFEEPVSKKRRVNKKEKKEQRKENPDKKKGRFFAPGPVEAEPEPEPRSRRKRAYSPGAPLPSDNSLDEEDDGDDGSSDDEGAFLSGAVTPWSTGLSPGPDVAQRLSNAQLRPYTSEFQPREGVNVATLKKGSLPTALGLGPAVAISLGEGETLAVVGTFRIVPLQHSVSLLSTTLRPAEDDVEVYPVFAPTCHPVPVIAPIINPDQLACSSVLEDIRLPKGFLRDATRAIVLLQENRTGIDSLSGDVVPGFNNVWAGEKGAWGLSGMQPVTANFTPVYAHTTPSSWSDALASLKQAPPPDDDDEDTPAECIPVVVVKGPKRSGKSSLARAALNHLLGDFARVAWLECDLGQGEFGPGGTVGLWLIDAPVLGPPFTHPREPARATYLGELSPQPCPDAYMAAVHSTIQHYQYEVQYPPASLQGASARRTDVVPLVVNTQGWTRGLGEELMRAIEVAAEPTHIFAFDEREDALDMVHSGGTVPQSARVFTVVPAPASPLQPRYSAADMRALALLSYMYSVGLDGRWDVSVPLFAHRPWVVTLGEGVRRAYLIGEGSEAVNPADLPLALNASLVALLNIPELEGPLYEQGSIPPEDATCLGLALVRAVRVGERTQLQLLTPLPSSTLARATAIVRNGALELPPAGMLDWRARVPGGGVPDEGLAGVRWEDVPFFDAAGSGAVGGERRRFRKNLQRKNQQG
ncbi:hypothetical protein CspeluHIS016_0103550 [Cutaneotrichosporon spelunceum]|uniref:Polynucleotide 5'-hydroxyl-kinase GRC3 n=1 Tax=Cutaneotrichosporon spelunceum TaxID=1672016 RepID=A0AAD3Y9K6_9TREE|nr:hypothetical protein CspeluHIS016_0103550 [Cutaneotrichosporon spelunceum]